MSKFIHELMEMALTHDTIVMTVVLMFVILGVLWLTALLRRTHIELSSVFELKSCDLCYRSPYHGEELDDWRNVQGFRVCSDCANEFP